MSEPKIYHQCGVWEFSRGRKKTVVCVTAAHAKYNAPPPSPKPTPRYTFEEAVAQIDICANCRQPIPETHRYHHCEECLPAWLERIAKINAQQERGEGAWHVY